MAKVFIEETTLTAIGDAIREKEGTTELVPVNDMATRISAIETGGGGDLPEEAFNITGDCEYRFANGGWDWFIEGYGNKTTTEGITNLTSAFSGSTVKKIPFVINIVSCGSCESVFADMSSLEECPKIRGTILDNKTTSGPRFSSMLKSCSKIRDFENLFEPSMLDGLKTFNPSSSSYLPRMLNFSGCVSLRRLPTWWYKLSINPELSMFTSASYTIYYNAFLNCSTLDEVLDIPVWVTKKAVTSNMFSYTFECTTRVKDVTFETSGGQPIVANWKSQVLDLSRAGYALDGASVNLYNSGITIDKKVNSDETYQALKNDPDWYTEGQNVYKWSRYDHSSAVETINSLPDTSAYLATQSSGTNTIKFKGEAGSNTDGGAINTLTAEEIAVATAKGWTVTLV